MASPDVSTLTSSFVEFGGSIFGKNVLNWELSSLGIQVRTNVNAPQAMTKLSAQGTPRPYATGDNTTGNGPKFTDRVLTAYQSKWDYDFDPEEFRNTYLANASGNPFYQEALNQISAEYLDHITRSTLYLGVRNGAGTAPADITDGWGTLIAALITATTITPVATGVITDANAVTKVEQVAEAVPAWMRQKGFIVYCSYATIDKYKKHYRTLNGFGFNKNEVGQYQLDGINAVLRPVAFMGTSARLIATVKDNLVFGTDMERVAVAASMRRNVSEVRMMIPAGCQIQDLDALVVNDQA